MKKAFFIFFLLIFVFLCGVLRNKMTAAGNANEKPTPNFIYISDLTDNKLIEKKAAATLMGLVSEFDNQISKFGNIKMSPSIYFFTAVSEAVPYHPTVRVEIGGAAI